MSSVTISDEGLGSVNVSETVETVVIDEGDGPPGPPGPPGTGDLVSTNNLSDLDNPAVARDNLGLGTAATHPSGDFANAADVVGLLPLPPGGGTGEVLGKLSPADNDFDWINSSGGGGSLPAGGTTHDLLVKQSNVDGDALFEAVDATFVGADPTGTAQTLNDALVNVLGTSAYRNVGTTSSDVAAGDAPANAIASQPTVDVDSIGVPTDPADKADFVTLDIGDGELVTYLRAGNLATLDDIVSGGGAADAAHLPFTPNGSISATDVQAAIEEVRDEAAGGTSLTYTHTQDVASTLWSVAHGLGAYVNVTVVDSLVRQVEADVEYVDTNTITIGFATATTGQAFLS